MAPRDVEPFDADSKLAKKPGKALQQALKEAIAKIDLTAYVRAAPHFAS